MVTAGMYETSGEWLYEIGLPGKSGIGGGILAVAPGKGGLARIIHGRVGETPDLSRGSSWRLRGRGAGRMPPFPQVG